MSSGSYKNLVHHMRFAWFLLYQKVRAERGCRFHRRLLRKKGSLLLFSLNAVPSLFTTQVLSTTVSNIHSYRVCSRVWTQEFQTQGQEQPVKKKKKMSILQGQWLVCGQFMCSQKFMCTQIKGVRDIIIPNSIACKHSLCTQNISQPISTIFLQMLAKNGHPL